MRKIEKIYRGLFLLFILPASFAAIANASNSTNNIVFSDTLWQGRAFKTRMLYLHTLQKENIYRFDADQELKDGIHKSILIPSGKIRIMAVGDVMPGTDYPSSSYLPPNCIGLFSNVKDLFSEADLVTANLEGVFASDGGTPKNCKDTLNCYVFRMPDSYAACIRDAGIDILGVANNHVNDFGYEGRLNTIRRLDDEGIPFAGFPERPEVIVEMNGLTVGFVAFAPHTGTVDFKDYGEAARRVADLKSRTDLVIVNYHSGAEGKDHQHITREDEIFLGHNRGNPWYFAHKVIDAGADLVVGHGPHVVRAIEFYKGKLIAYSLGNFCTWSRFNLSGPNAYAPVLEINLDGNGSFISGKIHSFIQLGEGGPTVDPLNRAVKKINELSNTDFPENGEIIDEHGNIIFPD